jgi:Domain of unknown function (DUF1885)
LSESTIIKLVDQSEKQTVSIEEVKELFRYYKELTNKTGKQLNWEYDEAAFPYEIKEPSEGKDYSFYLYSSAQPRYHLILVGVGNETESDCSFIQISLHPHSGIGDKGKANEFAKFLAKKLKGELHLFNKRIMYFYPRK